MLNTGHFVFQAQIDEFEKLLTAVHTRGLENVESPEMDEENAKEGSSMTAIGTPLPSKGRPKTRRGQWLKALTIDPCHL